MFIKYSFDNFHVLKFIKIVILMKDVNSKDEIYKDESKIGKCLAEKEIRILIGAGRKNKTKKNKKETYHVCIQSREEIWSKLTELCTLFHPYAIPPR